MSRVLVDETDEAFIARANLVFYLDDDRTQLWDESPDEIMTWKDVFMSFVQDKNGAKTVFTCAIMNVLILESDDAGRSQIGLDKLMARTRTKTKRTFLKALQELEQDGLMFRHPKNENEIWLEQRLVKRAKGIVEKMARATGYDVDIKGQISTIPATNHSLS